MVEPEAGDLPAVPHLAAAASMAETERDYVRPGRPVVLTGALTHWRALATWTPELIGSIVGSQLVWVLATEDGIAGLIPGEPLRHRVERMEASRAAALIAGWTPGSPRYFLSQKSFTRRFRLLAVDFEIPALVDKRRLTSVNLWLGSEGVITPLHFDVANNLIAQVRGRKRLHLFDPAQSPLLYPPVPWDERNYHRSRVNLMRPDLARYPGFARARPVVCDLGPGDLLYLPPLWWHHVRSLDTSIAVNFWWTPPLDSCLKAANGLELLRAAYARDRFASIHERFDASDAGGFIDIARRLAAVGPTWLAALFAGGALDERLRSRAGEGCGGAAGGAAAAASDERVEGLRRRLARIAEGEAIDDREALALVEAIESLLGRAA